MDLVYLLVGIVVGVLIGWLLKAFFSEKGNPLSAAEQTVQQSIYETLYKDYQKLQATLEAKNQQCEELSKDLAVSEQTVEHYNEKLKTQQTDLLKSQDLLKSELENLANRLFEEKSVRFSEHNVHSINNLLSPMRERFSLFESRLESVHKEESEQRIRLHEQVRFLAELNQQMSDDAQKLVNALKGNTKIQGNWGELVLEKVLEKSGLSKGREYEVQDAHQNTEGNRHIPDVIIYLPENKHLIIDSKVSLVAYERFISSDDDASRRLALREHIQSLKNHIKGLSSKQYASLNSLNSPDFVMLFVPIESALSIALEADSELLYEAFKMNVILVTPSTLMATARTVSGLWKQVQQNLNAREIARLGGELYDHIVEFAVELEQVGTKLKQVDKTYENAVKKLQTGRNSLMSGAKRLESLGVNHQKTIPFHLDQIEGPDSSAH